MMPSTPKHSGKPGQAQFDENAGRSAIESGAHVDLVNLGAPIVYTTNFDDTIEDTYRILGIKHKKIALPKDVATTRPDEIGIVNYHGDLRHESSLILTESSYHRRLNFESPLDLKFRADLLGRAVLFVGYGFNDLNIKVIWFRLMDMMHEVAAGDRPTSYIVSLTPNPVREELYASVGISTIVLDPHGTATEPGQQTQLLADFLHALARAVCSNERPYGQGPFLSMTAIRLLIDARDSFEKRTSSALRIPRRLRGTAAEATGLRDELAAIDGFTVPAELRPLVSAEFVARLRPADIEGIIRHRFDDAARALTALALSVMERPEASTVAAEVVQFALLRDAGREYPRHATVPWALVWNGRFDPAFAEILILRADAEVQAHESFEYDDVDVFYAADICARIAAGGANGELPQSIVTDAAALLDRVGEMYPSFTPNIASSGMPNYERLSSLVEERQAESESADDDDWEDEDRAGGD